MNTNDTQPHILDFDYKKGIFARENLCPEDLANLCLIVKNLKEKIAQIKVYLKTLGDTQELDEAVLEKIWHDTKGGSLSIETNFFRDDKSELLSDIKLFIGHDFAQLADYTFGRNTSIQDDLSNLLIYKDYLKQSRQAVLACYENVLSILTGEEDLDTQYPAKELLTWFQEVLNRRFYMPETPYSLSGEKKYGALKDKGCLDKDGNSVYDPFRLHVHVDPHLSLPGSTGATLLISMYNWAKNSITTGEMRGRLYTEYVKDPMAIAYGDLLEKRMQENGGHIDVHMEVFETQEAYIGCVSDTGVGFDLNALKQALFELTKDEEKMSDLLRLGIVSEDMARNLQEWEHDPRAYGKLLADLPSLLKIPRFSSANDKRLELVGMKHSGIGLFGIEVAAQASFATTFITEQRNGGACMIMVIPKDPEKYRKDVKDNLHIVRERTGNLLFETPPHLKKVA